MVDHFGTRHFFLEPADGIYASAWTAVQYFFFSNWGSIEAYYTVLQYYSSVRYLLLMSSGPVRRFTLRFKIIFEALHKISPFASKCLDITYIT
jgi:hypothetical protein